MIYVRTILATLITCQCEEGLVVGLDSLRIMISGAYLSKLRTCTSEKKGTQSISRDFYDGDSKRNMIRQKKS